MEAVAPVPTREKLPEIGGVLILVGIGLAVTLVRILASTVSVYAPLFEDGGAWELLATPESDAYIPYWGTLVMGEIFCNALLAAFNIYLLALFFRRSKRFPKLFLWMAFASIGLLLVDSLLTALVLPDQKLFDEETGFELGRAFVFALIWIPYMRTSKRVRKTFIKP